MDPLEAIQTLEQTQDPSVDPLQNFDPSLPFAFGFVGAVGLFLLTGYFINSYLKNKKVCGPFKVCFICLINIYSCIRK